MRRALFILLLAAAACSAQKTTDYAGEPLVQVRGTIITSAASSTDPTIALVWINYSRHADPNVTQTIFATARGEFPARFTIDVLSTPRPELLNDFGAAGTLPDGGRIGVAFIFAVPRGTTTVTGQTPVLGVVEDFIVTYVETDLVPHSIVARLFGGPLAAGFHLMRIIRGPPLAAAQVAACNAGLPPGVGAQERYVRCHSAQNNILQDSDVGFGADVPLRLAPENDLVFPTWQ